MTRHHTHPDHTPTTMGAHMGHTAHVIVSGYTTERGAARYVSTHTAPHGHTYVVVPTAGHPDNTPAALSMGTGTYDVWCAPTATIDAQSARDAMESVTLSTMADDTAPAWTYGVPVEPTYGAPTATDPMCDTCPDGDAPHTYASHLDDTTDDMADTPTYVDDNAPSADDIADDDARRADPYAWVDDTYRTASPAELDPTLLFIDPAPGAPIDASTMVARFDHASAANAWIAATAPHTTTRTHHGTSYTVPTDAYGNTYGYDTDGAFYTVWARPSDPTDAPSAITCAACGAPAVPFDTVAVGTHITVHTMRAGVTGTIEHTYTGTVGHTTTDDGYTYGYVALDAGGTWTTPRTDYIVHVTAPAHDTVTPSTDVDGTDRWTYIPTGHLADRHGVRIVGAWVDPYTNAPAVHTYTGPVYRDTTDAYADVAPGNESRVVNGRGHMVAEGTYHDGVRRTITYDTDTRTYYDGRAAVTGVSWVMAGGRTCNHRGSCIAPYGHPTDAHHDVHGDPITGPALSPYAAPIGCDIPATYARVVTRMPFHRDTFRTVLRPDLAAMVVDYRHIMAALGVTFDTYGAAYAAIVRTMPNGTYEPATDHYDTYAWVLDTHYAVND